MTGLRKDDGTLDTFIRRYCTLCRIRIDGDIFSHAFSARDAFSRKDAAHTIEYYAGLYGMYQEKDADIY